MKKSHVLRIAPIFLIATIVITGLIWYSWSWSKSDYARYRNWDFGGEERTSRYAKDLEISKKIIGKTVYKLTMDEPASKYIEWKYSHLSSCMRLFDFAHDVDHLSADSVIIKVVSVDDVLLAAMDDGSGECETRLAGTTKVIQNPPSRSGPTSPASF
jgi:hypothetical protein